MVSEILCKLSKSIIITLRKVLFMGPLEIHPLELILLINRVVIECKVKALYNHNLFQQDLQAILNLTLLHFQCKVSKTLKDRESIFLVKLLEEIRVVDNERILQLVISRLGVLV